MSIRYTAHMSTSTQEAEELLDTLSVSPEDADQSDALWLGLCAATESNLPHEWPALISVMINRMEGEDWPDTGAGVVLEPKQFSYFNSWLGDTPWEVLVNTLSDRKRVWIRPIIPAVRCAEYLLFDREYYPRMHSRATTSDPTHGADHYWSPRSMPGLAAPYWAGDKEWIAVPGIDPKRFIFQKHG